MPRYLDHHPTDRTWRRNSWPKIIERLRTGLIDEFGEKGLNVFVGAEETYCYTEAPSPEAVQASHAALGITISAEDVIEVQVLP